MAKTCEYEPCSEIVTVVPGKVQRRFCSPKCQKAAKRAEIKDIGLRGCPVVDEPDPIGIKPPTTDKPTADKSTTDSPQLDAFKLKPNRKTVKCFDDLPSDVRQTILVMSDSEEDKRRRTSIAINYHRTFSGTNSKGGRALGGVGGL